ncbi:MAG: GNAT family N-acetyltransferase [Burkholderiales bacterium]|nr:MAG: GNAT family N-acetyltransferase [Betaproteobacteria bacterium]TAG28834.1 MAG: GNAT family N-acetyltransferase [Burkholderiales bacterium]TAG47973.1 MAG: GNAT family N-acetyltransferase [Betaproteobacteria bacterium]
MQPTISEGYAPGCIGRIAQLHAAYYSATHGFGAAFEAKVATELAAFCASYVKGRDGLWLANQTSNIEGSIAIDGTHATEHFAHLRWFISSDMLRGKGIGRELLSRALAFCDEQRYQRVHLWTFAGLDAARHLYESHGFRLQHESPGSQWGTVVREQRFVREAT